VTAGPCGRGASASATGGGGELESALATPSRMGRLAPTSGWHNHIVLVVLECQWHHPDFSSCLTLLFNPGPAERQPQ
jgi:hypothetical protein